MVNNELNGYCDTEYLYVCLTIDVGFGTLTALQLDLAQVLNVVYWIYCDWVDSVGLPGTHISDKLLLLCVVNGSNNKLLRLGDKVSMWGFMLLLTSTWGSRNND